MAFVKRAIVLAGVLAFTAPFVANADESAAPATINIAIPTATFDAAIKDYLHRNPEAVSDALQAFQAKQEQKKHDDAQAAISTKEPEIYGSNSPTAGNPNGSETLVEFFDYSCHYCKQIHPDLKALISQDPNLKVVFKDFPILGPGSMLAAKAALAANMQGKYLPMHDALLDLKGAVDDAAIQSAASTAGVDYAKLKTDMDNPDIAKQLADNSSLANALNIHGTPSMIINKQLVDGALPLEELKKKVASKG